MAVLDELKLVKKALPQVKVGKVRIGSKKVVVMAGPCAVESKQQLLRIARAVKDAGASILRGGAFKPRTSPYSFQGLGEVGLKLLAQAREEVGLPVLTEVMSPEEVKLVAKYADILQIGCRNMQNFRLLKAVGKTNKPVLLKRGMGAKVEEWLASAEYILKEGNPHVVLCERGIRTFETLTRFTLDLASLALVKRLTPLPVVVDPSHGTGKRELVVPMAKAAIAAGADGILVEVHHTPSKALSDGFQSLTLEGFVTLMKEIAPVVAAVKRKL
jgi:3-deoxy-7-phosphoheptulonate synthase